MSEAFLKGTTAYLPSAAVRFDRYHVRSHLSKAVDEVRREESKHHKDLLKNTRYMWLKRPANLTERQRDLLDELLAQPLQTVRAYTLAQQSGSFYERDDPDTAEEFLRRWITEVDSSGLEPLQKFARMLEDHWDGVTRRHHSRISSGLLEGLNSLSQAAKRRDRGYHQPQLHRDDLPHRLSQNPVYWFVERRFWLLGVSSDGQPSACWAVFSEWASSWASSSLSVRAFSNHGW